jgi:hypothetical protein
VPIEYGPWSWCLLAPAAFLCHDSGTAIEPLFEQVGFLRTLSREERWTCPS